MKCWKCGSQNPKDAKFCENCGSNLAKVICPKCGHENRSGAVHCSQCGASLKIVEKVTKPADKKEKTRGVVEQPKRKIHPFVWVLIGLFGLAAVFAVLFFTGVIDMPINIDMGGSEQPAEDVSGGQLPGQQGGGEERSDENVPQATGNTVEANYNCDGKDDSPIYAAAGDQVVIKTAWLAGTQEQVQDYIDQVEYTITLDGSEIPVIPDFSEIQIDPDTQGYITRVNLEIGPLNTGTHHVKTNFTWNEQIYDGADYYGPGSETEGYTGNCTIIIGGESDTGAASSSGQGQPVFVGEDGQDGGKGCEFANCNWMPRDQCEECGGTWLDFGIEAYCSCKGEAQTMQEWCDFEGGKWVDDENRCTFDQSTCQFVTCHWMNENRCDICGGTYRQFPDGEEFCDCSGAKRQSEEIEWCQNEGGTWLEAEMHCTFEDVNGGIGDLGTISACPNISYTWQANDDDNYFAFKAACKEAGGVDQCSDYECNNMVCVCPNAENAATNCDWLAEAQAGASLSHEVKCYEENNSCWLIINSTGALNDLSHVDGKPEVVVTTSTGQVLSSTEAKRRTGGCTWNAGNTRISCEILEDGSFDTNSVEDIYFCHGLCCMDLKKLESSGFFGLAGNCPMEGDLEVQDFQIESGKLTLKINNQLGWNTNEMEVDFKDAKGSDWTTVDCKRDSSDDQVMKCEGWAVFKSGYATMSFSSGSGGSICSINDMQFDIPWLNPCSASQSFCPAIGACCSSGYTCCPCGCMKLDSSYPTCSSACS